MSSPPISCWPVYLKRWPLVIEAVEAAANDLPVGLIAGSLGFTSPAYFTRAFQHQVGKSPSAFRRAP